MPTPTPYSGMVIIFRSPKRTCFQHPRTYRIISICCRGHLFSSLRWPPYMVTSRSSTLHISQVRNLETGALGHQQIRASSLTFGHALFFKGSTRKAGG